MNFPSSFTKVMTSQGRVRGVGAGFVDIRIEKDKYPDVKDIFNNQSLTGRYIRQDTTHIYNEYQIS